MDQHKKDLLSTYQKQELVAVLTPKKIFNCTMCQNLLTPPIMLIKDLGNICNGCCARNKFDGIRNDALEQILAETVIPCSYGCREVVVYKNLESHLDGCKLRQFECLIESCKWLGLLQDFVKHFREKHSNHVITKNLENGLVYNVNILNKEDHFKLVDAGLNSCFLKFYYNEKSRTLSLWIFDARDTDSANGPSDGQYKVKLVCMNNKSVQGGSTLHMLKRFNDKYGTLKTIGIILSKLSKEKAFVTAIIKLEKKDGIDKIKENLGCPVCNEVMTGPIFQCTTGHSICKNCRLRIFACPTCQSSFAGTRNYALERLVSEIL